MITSQSKNLLRFLLIFSGIYVPLIVQSQDASFTPQVILGCGGTVVDFVIDANQADLDEITQFTWSFDNGNADFQDLSVDVGDMIEGEVHASSTYLPSATAYTVTLTIVTSSGSDTKTEDITIVELPEPDFGG